MRPLAVTVGDCAGVGPELILTAGRTLADEVPLVVYGSAAVLRAALADLEARSSTGTRFEAVVKVTDPAEAAELEPGTLAVVDCPIELPLPQLAPFPWGRTVPAFGALQYAALVAAIDAATRGDVRAILTAPWHKALLASAGLPPTGHTEVLRERTGAADAVMMLGGDVLRVALVTDHVPLAGVPSLLTVEGIVSTARVMAAGLRSDFGIELPRIAVCGLNPHAGEEGTMGHEDATIIAPAIAALRREGIDATGPHPADTLFPRVVKGRERADGVVAMYHDQGLVPLKTVHFGEAANVTLGLPFVRTSVDHGTAYDIAGRGEVDAGSFLYAGRLAVSASSRRA